MNLRPQRPFKERGSPPGAAWLNHLVDQVVELQGSAPSSGENYISAASGQWEDQGKNPPILARITGKGNTSYNYKWQLILLGEPGPGTYTDAFPGILVNDNGEVYAIEINGNTNVPTGTIVELNPCSHDGNRLWFDYPASQTSVGPATFSGARVSQDIGTVSQHFVNHTVDHVILANIIYDTDSYFNGGSPTKFTIPETGYYSIEAEIYLLPSLDGGPVSTDAVVIGYLQSAVSGIISSRYATRFPAGGAASLLDPDTAFWICHLSCQMYLVIGDYIQANIGIESDSDGPTEYVVSTDWPMYSWMSISKLVSKASLSTITQSGMQSEDLTLLGTEDGVGIVTEG